MYEGPGIYRHYKVAYYRILGVAQHESNGARMVIYHSYSIEHELNRMEHGVDFIARPLNQEDGPDWFNEHVMSDGGTIPRFEKVA